MKPSEIRASVASLIQAGRPPFIWGNPGIGKSQNVAQVAQSMGVPMIDLRMVQLDPVDMRGLPFVDSEGRSSWAKPSFLPRDGRGILFLDEFPQAVQGVQNAASELILDRRIGEYSLPDGWSIVGAGNPTSARAATHKMPTHLARRFVHLDMDPDLEEWTRHALTNGFSTPVIAFMQFRGAGKDGIFNRFNPISTDRAFPNPASWEFVSDIHKTTPDPAIEMKLYEGCVGNGAAAEFVGFLQVWRTLPSIASVLMNPATADVPTDPATRYAMAGALAAKATDANFHAVVTYANRMPPEFNVLIVRRAVQRAPEVQQTRAFIEWTSANQDVLI